MGRYSEDDENVGEMECPNCGERVYEEVLVCPRCGLHFYPDEESSPEVYETPSSNKAFSFSAILAGWVVSAGIAFLINYAASRIWSPQALSPGGQFLVSAAAPVGALAGGYLAAVLAREKVFIHGLAVALPSLLSAILLETFWFDPFSQPLRPATVFNWIALLLAGVLGAWIWSRTNAIRRFPSWPKPGQQRLYNDLLPLVRHDINTAERLIDYERRRIPNATREQLIKNAIDRLNRDRR